MKVIGDLSRVNARRYPQKIALSFEGRTLTYRQLDDQSNQFANALIASGTARGDRVALLAFNCLEYAIISQAAAKADAILVPLNFRLVARELRDALLNAEPTVLVSEAAFSEVIAEAVIGLSSPPRIVMMDATVNLSAATTLGEFMAPHAATPPDMHVEPTSACVIIYTSGTTGAPKGVLVAHETYLRMYVATAIETGLRHTDVFLMAVPMFHAAGLNMMLHQALFLGATGVIYRGALDPAQIFSQIERHRISMMVLVPTIVGMLAQHPVRDRHDLSSWRMAFYGSMPMPTPVLQLAMSVFPHVAFHQLYGSTESGLLSVLTWDEHARHARSTGREALLSDMRIRTDDGRDAEPGEIGEILGAHAGGMIGYWHNDRATAETIVDGWIHTGDRARQEADGFFLILGRIKETINSGGEKIDPLEVERVLTEHPSIREVAVFGVPDALFGESVCAAVSLFPDALANSDELDVFCRSRLAGYKRPRRYEYLEALPRNAADKVEKAVLRARVTESSKCK